MSSGPGGIQGVGQRWAGRGSHENWKHEDRRDESHPMIWVLMGVIWKTRITWNTGLVMLKWGGQSWNIYFPRAFQTTHQNGEQIFNSVKGTNLQYFCAVACWHSVLQVPTWCLVVGENGVLGKHNIFFGSLARVAVAFSPPSFKHVSVQRMFRFLITMFDMFAKRNKWFATTVWKRFFQIQGTSIRTYSLASARSNYNVKRPAAIAKNVGTGDLSASPIPSGLLRSSARSNRATANVWTSLLCMLVLGNSCYRLFGKRIACPW